MTTNAPAQPVLLSVDGGVATLMLNRPGKRNALDAATIAALDEGMRSVDAREDVRVLLLCGAGTDFCSGADLSQLEKTAANAGPLDNLADAMELGDLFITMRRAAKPIIAAVHGHALAGGAGLATAADLIVASESAKFGYPEVHLGFVPAMVTALLRRTLGEKATFELIALGTSFSAADAARLGLVCRVFRDDDFAAASHSFALELAARSTSAVQLCKRLLYGIDGVSFEAAIARGADINVLARSSAACQEGVRQFLDKRKR
ncbi:MAG: enoyl-CoA hydratase/isomerase family protein [Longimicrobiales bacterium]